MPLARDVAVVLTNYKMKFNYNLLADIIFIMWLFIMAFQQYLCANHLATETGFFSANCAAMNIHTHSLRHILTKAFNFISFLGHMFCHPSVVCGNKVDNVFNVCTCVNCACVLCNTLNDG